MTNHDREPTNDPRWSWIFISVMGFVALCYVVLVATPYLSERRRRIEEGWPQTTGIPIGTRVVEEPATRTFRYRAYVGECSVTYSVGEAVHNLDRRWVYGFRSWCFGWQDDRVPNHSLRRPLQSKRPVRSRSQALGPSALTSK